MGLVSAYLSNFSETTIKNGTASAIPFKKKKFAMMIDPAKADRCTLEIAPKLYSSHFLKISDPFVPPKPKELESAMFTGAFRALFGT